VKGLPVGRRSNLIELTRLVVHPDRVEQLSYSLFGLEVRRLFFDELSCATVHRRFATWVELAFAGIALLVGLVLAGVGLWQRWPMMVAGGGLALLTFLSLLLAAWLEPPHELTVWADRRSLRTLLPRRTEARERALQHLLRAVEGYQRRHASQPGRRAPVAPAPAPPPAGPDA
jgi:hypothetical protein